MAATYGAPVQLASFGRGGLFVVKIVLHRRASAAGELWIVAGSGWVVSMIDDDAFSIRWNEIVRRSSANLFHHR